MAAATRRSQELIVVTEAEFVESIKRNDLTAVQHALAEQPALSRSVGGYAKTPLHLAAEYGYLDIARLLLDAGSDIAARTTWGATPLDWAATLGHGEIVDLLLSRGAPGLTVVTAAAVGKFDDVIALLATDAGGAAAHAETAHDPPNEYWPADSARIQGDVRSDAMYAAARNGHERVVEYLLDHGASVNVKGLFGATALHWAAINGHTRTVELLVRRGADLQLRDVRFDGTAADWATEGGHTELARLLSPR